MLAVALRSKKIIGIKTGSMEGKIALYADDTLFCEGPFTVDSMVG